MLIIIINFINGGYKTYEEIHYSDFNLIQMIPFAMSLGTVKDIVITNKVANAEGGI